MSSKKMPNIVGAIDAPGCEASTAMTVGACWAETTGEIDKKITAIRAKQYFGAMGFGSILNAEGNRGAKFALMLAGPVRAFSGQKISRLWMPCLLRDVRDFHKCTVLSEVPNIPREFHELPEIGIWRGFRKRVIGRLHQIRSGACGRAALD